ncbi:hypothetical protein GMI70_01790 [Eggerthellaceae bacterium zg-893]|nr:hypothetical protein [Eggerthellaceae bacterium zg-893]
MNESAIEYLSARQYVYLVMQRLFGTDPALDVIEAVETDVLEAALAVLLDGSQAEGGLEGAPQRLVERLASLQEDCSEDALDRLQGEYARCFVGPASLPAPPFESVYVDRRRILMTETTLKVRRTYQASGFEPTLCGRVPDDHVALELDFLAVLARNACECVQAGDEASCIEYLKTSRKFLDDHLGLWAGRFAQAMREKSGSAFYADLASCLERCIAADQAGLAHVLGVC